jgi:hypothetical protein
VGGCDGMKGIINKAEKIDWCKVMLVQCGSTIVLTTGQHTKEKFEGIKINSLTELKCVNSWSKAYFSKVTTPTNVTFI